MGNCTSGLKKKKKGNITPTDGSNENKPNEDVTYASINHPTAQGSRQDKVANEPKVDNDCDYATVKIPEVPQIDNDCAYATVKIPEEVQADSHSESSKDDCPDDYVLMA
ncbi:uncharacterized protein si:ch211-214p13.7 [Fundulus heteroclitus]|uniref:uncharacterized protein si:ch211-214p13.7 n=1 Tax=Fundulus heteroclitus TaxID=8078 RepID=UPI00165B0765|nr:uncharacterized protein si:ch211-214p13.7 [Fundulus heteroclitus]